MDGFLSTQGRAPVGWGSLCHSWNSLRMRMLGRVQVHSHLTCLHNVSHKPCLPLHSCLSLSHHPPQDRQTLEVSLPLVYLVYFLWYWGMLPDAIRHQQHQWVCMCKINIVWSPQSGPVEDSHGRLFRVACLTLCGSMFPMTAIFCYPLSPGTILCLEPSTRSQNWKCAHWSKKVSNRCAKP